jgi:hypothetical protein
LNFFIIDAIRLATVLIDNLARGETKWPTNLLDKHAEDRKMDKDPTMKNHLSEWLDIRFIGECTKTEGKLIVYPFYLLLIMIMARSSWFDTFSWPWSLVIVFGINAALALHNAFRLQRSAERARQGAVKSLTEKLVRVLGPHRRKTRDQIRQTIKEIEDYKEGAFQSLKDRPLFHACLLLGGTGILSLVQFFNFLK